jgi:hypothetical protein
LICMKLSLFQHILVCLEIESKHMKSNYLLF